MRALKRMRQQGIVPKHQFLDNRCHGLLKQAIKATQLSDGSISKMTYELVPPEEHQRNMAKKVYSNIQRPFRCGLEWVSKNHANAPVGPTTPTGGMTTTPTMTVPSKPRHVGICTCVPRPTQLQQAPICTNRNGIPGACQTRQTTDICTALQKRLCHRHIVRTLPVSKDLDEGHA